MEFSLGRAGDDEIGDGREGAVGGCGGGVQGGEGMTDWTTSR